MILLSLLISELNRSLSKKLGNDALREIRLLAAHVLNTTYENIFFNDERIILDNTQMKALREATAMRLNHMPLAKIIGKKEFWGLPFEVTLDTLDPRPESETLIEAILILYADKQQALNILDLGTGSGCLLLSTLHEYPAAKGIGVDISMKALTIAQKNATKLNLKDRCKFIRGTWFKTKESSLSRFDIIISNPPYIPRGNILSPDTLYDPASALFAGEKGLLHYRLILEEAHHYLTPQGVIVFEIGQGQQSDVINLALKNNYHIVIVRKDILGHTRCLVFRKNKE